MELSGDAAGFMYYSHLMGPHIASNIENNQSIYQVLNIDVETNPNKAALWDSIISLAEKEHADDKPDAYLPHVPLKEMITIGRELQHASNQKDRYHALMKRCSNGVLWYDIILSGNANMLASVYPFLHQEVHTRGAKFERGLDIGTGSGNVISEMHSYCKEFVGMDVLHEPLLVASSRNDVGDKTSVNQGNATHLPYADKCFDLILSNGLTHYLNRIDESHMDEEIDRVLQPGGVYVTIWSGFHAKETEKYISGAKELLDNLMGKMIVADAPEPYDQLSSREQIAQFQNKGYGIIETPMVRRHYARIFRKPI